MNIRVGTASLSFLGRYVDHKSRRDAALFFCLYSLFVILTIWLFRKYVVFTQVLLNLYESEYA